MSSSEDEKESLNNLFSEDIGSDSEESLDDAFSDVSSELTNLRRQLHEERFCWVVVSIILLDVVFFDKETVWAIPVVIMLLELILILVIAQRLGVATISAFLYRIIDSYAGKRAKD